MNERLIYCQSRRIRRTVRTGPLLRISGCLPFSPTPAVNLKMDGNPPLLARVTTLAATVSLLTSDVAGLKVALNEERKKRMEEAEEHTDVVEHLERKLAALDDKTRRNNVVMYGMTTDADHVAEAVEAEFAKSGADQPKLSAVYYVGKPKNSPVIAQFVNTLQRDQAFASIRSKQSTVKVKPDFCPRTRRARGMLYGTLLRLKASSNAGPTPLLKGDKIVNGKSVYR